MEKNEIDLEKVLRKSESSQLALAPKVRCEDEPVFERDLVTGIDVSYQREKAYACAIVMHIPTQQVVRKESLIVDCEFPYIPGHFYLREAPVIFNILELIKNTGPILIDGNGILHPRRMGLASFIGVTLNRQTIGVAKTLHLGKIGDRTDSQAPIVDNGEVIGRALWIEKKTKPLYVSIGNQISLDTAIEVVLAASFTNTPEPLHQAHTCSVNLRSQSD